jgi:hypothetical protein
MTTCGWNRQCEQPPTSDGYCYLHSKVSKGLVDTSYPAGQGSGRTYYTRPDAAGRRLLERLYHDDESEDVS